MPKRTYNPLEPNRPYRNSESKVRGVSFHKVAKRYQVVKRGKFLGYVDTLEQGRKLWERN